MGFIRLEETSQVDKEIFIHRIYNKENTNIFYKYRVEDKEEPEQEESKKVFVRDYQDTNVLF